MSRNIFDTLPSLPVGAENDDKADIERIRSIVHKEIDQDTPAKKEKPKDRKRRFVPLLAAAVVLIAALVIGSVAVLGRGDEDYYNDLAQKEYSDIYSRYFKKFESEGIPESVRSIPDSELYSLGDFAMICAKRDMVDKIIKTVGSYSGKLPQNYTSENYAKDRGVYYEFLTECAAVYKNSSAPPEEKGRIWWWLRQAYFSLDNAEMDPYIEDFEAVRLRRDQAMTAIESIGIEPTQNRKNMIAAGFKDGDPIPWKQTYKEILENIVVDPLQEEYDNDLKAKKDAYSKKLEELIGQGVTEYEGYTPLKDNQQHNIALELAMRDMQQETFEIVKKYGGAEDAEPAIAYHESAPSSKWRKHAAYLNECYELYFSGKLTEYEKYCIFMEFYSVSIPDRVSNAEVNEILKNTKAQKEEITQSNDDRIENLRNAGKAEDDPEVIYRNNVKQFTARMKELEKEAMEEAERLVSEGVKEYRGIKPIYAGSVDYVASILSKQYFELEVFEMVKSHGKAQDIDEPILSAVTTTKDPEKWRAQCEYISDCYELYFSDALTDYEKFCISYAASEMSIPKKVSDKDVTKLLETAKLQQAAITTGVPINSQNK